MVTLEQVKAGLTAYIDDEILPRIDGYKRYGFMVYLALLMQNFTSRAQQVAKMPAVSVLGVVDDSGHVDIDRIHDAAYKSMQDHLQVDIPVVGRFAFSRSDVDKLCDLIRRAAL